MSAPPEITKESIAELFRAVLAEEEYFDRMGQLPDVEGQVFDEASSARAALMRSAGIPPGVDFAREVQEGALMVADERLKRYGCDFGRAAYMLLAALNVTPDARDFLILLLFISGGSSDRRLIVTDEKLGQLSGLSERTIRRKRHAYREWLDERGWVFVRFHESPFDPSKGRTPPTEYEVLWGDAVIKFVREWRTYYQTTLQHIETEDPKQLEDESRPALWSDMREEKAATAFAESTRPEVVVEIGERIAADFMALDPGTRRKAQKKSDAPKEPKDKLALNEAKILNLIAECRDEARQRGRGAYSWWVEFKGKVAVKLSEQTPGFPDPDEAD